MDSILCDELLEEVLNRLPRGPFFDPSIAVVSLVSKRWLRLYRSTKFNLFLRLSPDNGISSFLSHFPHLSFLFIIIDRGHDDVDFSNFSDRILLSVASSCPKLTGLHLEHGPPVSLFPLLSLTTSCPHLDSLSISLSRPISFHWLVFLPSLVKLTVVFNPVPGEVEQADTSKRNFNAELKLETLVLDGIQSGDYGFDSLWKSCKNLKRLELYRCEGIGDDSSVLSFVNCFNGLQEVILRWCGSIVDDILMRLVENCTSLNSLLIHDKVEGSVEGLFHFITQSRCNLQKLDLRLPLDLEDNHLLAVAEKFRGLLSLRLCSCYVVTAEGLRTMDTLGQSFRNLRKLDLSYNEMLVDEEFISMLASCNCLRNLKVTGCEGLTNASLISMFKSCKQLEFVDIMNCPGIGAEAVELFVLNCLRLRALHVEDSKVSDVSRSWSSKKFIVERLMIFCHILPEKHALQYIIEAAMAIYLIASSNRQRVGLTHPYRHIDPNGEIDSVVESTGNVNVKLPCASFSNAAICANEGRVRIVGDGAWQKESLKAAAAWVAFDEGSQEIGFNEMVLFICPVVNNGGS
ncbi:hypothetical protein RHSIM_Rhsim08G0049900 [Rhododendron simsii]|uniref:F-box/LRR-repeat protein 15-like leucin rich repeat domain-containing protein n=1 Tax=Rhododendron simsii TaxID=118357 RepID=A0A834GIC3_RHOSS|nr:hypothetical protein RHSIM_Rhsim08G0049900 [Rhododendron simsii]